jgi:hypothetical protein
MAIMRSRRGLVAPPPRGGYPAVPLTPAEAQLLTDALEEDERQEQIERRPSSGASRMAADIRARAGVAAALGQPVIPVLASEVSLVGYVLSYLRRRIPDAAITADFGQLLARMQALTGTAAVRGWSAKRGPGGVRWTGVPPGQDAADQAPALPRGKRGRR